MKGLAVDTAISKITISAKNEEHTVTSIYDIGMHQSETLLPAIQYVLEKAGLTPNELDYIAITRGPGSFTGLRLGFSAVKALQIASKAPLYAFDTLDVYADNYTVLSMPVISCIDAKKDRFYAKGFCNIKMEEGDYTPEEIAAFLNKTESKDIIICGSDSHLLKENLMQITDKNLIPVDFIVNTAETLFKMAEKSLQEGAKPLDDYDGPFYLRASEAEVKLNA